MADMELQKLCIIERIEIGFKLEIPKKSWDDVLTRLIHNLEDWNGESIDDFIVKNPYINWCSSVEYNDCFEDMKHDLIVDYGRKI